METIPCSIDLQNIAKGESFGEITIGAQTYRVGPLSNIPGNKGGNSWVFYLYDTDSADNQDPQKVIKINRLTYKDENGHFNNNNKSRKNNKRIEAEIDALKDCKEKRAEYVIKIDTDGIIINKSKLEKESVNRFYTMEAAEMDLKKYMEQYEGDYLGRIKICIELTKSLKELFELGYYHRDIKPDNFFYIGDGIWKIGDLGLIAKRNLPNRIDRENEFIGPKGWTSPETMNKYLVNEKDVRFDRIIDEKSDIFQLGMVFWYVIQGNAPLGYIMEDDFLEKDHDLYNLIQTMIYHKKALRPQTFDSILEKLKQIADNTLI